MGSNNPNKIFVGGLPQSCADEVLSNYFEQYGTITDCVVMKDRETGNSRGFGFVTYESPSSVDMVMNQYDDHRIGDKWVEVKRATPRDQMPAPGAPTPSKGKGGGKGMPPPIIGGPAPSSGDVRPGDWRCPGCGANVFATKDSCFKCGEQKPRGGSRGPAPANGGGGACPGGGGYGGSPGYAVAPYGGGAAYGGYSPYGPAPNMSMVGPYGAGPYGGYGHHPAYGAYPMHPAPHQGHYGHYKGASGKGYSPY